MNCAELKEWLDCDSSMGILTWKRSPNRRVKPGSAAGNCRADGYVRVTINGVQFLAHRIVWALHYGEWPQGLLDHIDRNPSNNAISNLRLATYSQNAMNKAPQANNKSSVPGVRKLSSGKWVARIKVGKETIHLGNFEKFEEAYVARKIAEAHHFGAFAPSAACLFMTSKPTR